MDHQEARKLARSVENAMSEVSDTRKRLSLRAADKREFRERELDTRLEVALLALETVRLSLRIEGAK